jgi:hypothetical protein
MLRYARMAAMRKLRRGIGHIGSGGFGPEAAVYISQDDGN